MQTRTDAELMNEYVSRGDEAAFDEIVARHGAFVQRVCFRLLKDEHEAEDACQTVFLVLSQKARRLRGGDLSAWLYRVGHLVAAETVRKRMRRAEREERYAGEESVGGAVPAPDEGERQADLDAPDEGERQAVLDALDAELMALSGKNREAVLLRYLHGYSQEEAARIADCPVGTLSMRASRGLEELRRRLVKRGLVLGVPVLAAVLESESQAALPGTFLSSTITAVKGYAAGGAATAAVSANVAALTKGVLDMMFWIKVQTAVVAVVATLVVAGGGALVAQEAAKQPAAEKRNKTATDARVAEADGKTGAGKTEKKEAGGEIVKNLQLVLAVEKVEGGPKKPGFSADTIECVSGVPLRISFSVAVVNRGTEPLNVMDHWATGHGLRLVAPAGREMEEIKGYPFVRGDMTGPTAKDVKELAPGEKIRYTENLHVEWDPADKVHPGKALIFYPGGGTAWDISKPGKYRVIADYGSTDKGNFWDGKVASNAIELLVTGAGSAEAVADEAQRMLMKAEALLAEGKRNEAIALARKVLSDYPRSEFALQAQRFLERVAANAADSTEIPKKAPETGKINKGAEPEKDNSKPQGDRAKSTAKSMSEASGKLYGDYADMPLAKICVDLSGKTGRKITCDKECGAAQLTQSVNEADLKQSLEWMAALAGATLVEKENGDFHFKDR